MLFTLTYADMMEDTDGVFYVIETVPEPSFVTDFEGNIKCSRSTKMRYQKRPNARMGM
ncbi:MAG: hypothetical protein V4450_17340 [Bacteroidota bacterium]